MTDELEQVPGIVAELAKQVHMNPIKWHIEDDHITIVFEQGPKIRFDRPSTKTPATAKKSAAPAIQKLPVKRGRKS